ncbi:M20/M25/M40 family metallo-hydrolase [Streptomyces sp. VRA16 Mangrove soil]|uniref:M20/M25/M40 family metallo-hydrolase n=1 Tax=Streptomyces sp. VRA16 Mangrove soil TaxID=2817434 RepID=UPI001A9FFEF4|nr:M20/M25/M40 family metallo-hydrolase [Streptomyces sp. VRA16 Mangrove soil]MBO1334765.1 M20/M25/M40 family metallo-hydrolase [Streptomyces sp. VRA16 Mangrove soil]
MPEPAPAPAADPVLVRDFCDSRWDTELLPLVEEHIRVPAVSPAYDADWEAHGFLDRAARAAAAWLRTQAPALPGLRVEVLRSPGRTPLVFFEVPGHGSRTDETVLFYGHLDKQPEGDGWSEGRSAWEPVFDGTRLYGRGGADDGYALFAAFTAVRALAEQDAARPRCVGVFEAGEESGSPDLDHWFGALAPRIGEVGLVLCLDSGAGDYERLWLVTSLRGACGGTLDVRVLDEGAHSGDAGGVVPSTFRVARLLLDRLEDAATGELRCAALHGEVPAARRAQARDAARILGDQVARRFAWHADASPVTADPEELLLNRAWRPSLEVTGADGLPPVASAGNVLRPRTRLKLSLRLPPTVDAAAAVAEVARLLEADPPYGVSVRFTPDRVLADGWHAPAEEPWLAAALAGASRACFDGADLAHIGQGGTIPLMGRLSRQFPAAQFLACGVLGPGANAHGPNESLHVPYARRLTSALALTLNAFAHRTA